MLKNILIPLGLLWVLSASAQNLLSPYNLKKEHIGVALSILEQPVIIMDEKSCNYLKPITLPIDPQLPGTKFAQQCSNFIDYSGNVGAYGAEVRNYLLETSSSKSNFFNNDMPGMLEDPGMCPKWKKFTLNEKVLFWVWTMASISHAESSCDPKKVNWGRVPNSSDRPRGLFQLNTLKGNRKWRGPNCGFSSRPEDVFNPRNSIRCSLDIMDETLKGEAGEYKSNGKIYPTNSYWQHLRSKKPAGGKIAKLMKTFPLCD